MQTSQSQFPPNLAILRKPEAPKSMTNILDLAIKSSNLPEVFDSRDQWTYRNENGEKEPLIGPILNQGQCGSCYIFSSTEVLADRLSMAIGKPIGILSQQYILDCVKGNESQGCGGGGIPEYVLDWMSKNYVPLDTEFAYAGRDQPGCPQIKDAKWIGNGVYTVSNGDEDNDGAILAIKKELYANGPVTCAVTIYTDFMDWWTSQDAMNGGVYSPGRNMNSDTVDGGHALKIVGWDDHKQAWLIANSWAESGGVGNTGYFYQDYNDSVPNAPTGVNKQVVAICVNGKRAHEQYSANTGNGDLPKPYTCTLVQIHTPVPAEAILKQLTSGIEEFSDGYSPFESNSTFSLSSKQWILIVIVVIVLFMIMKAK